MSREYTTNIYQPCHTLSNSMPDCGYQIRYRRTGQCMRRDDEETRRYNKYLNKKDAAPFLGISLKALDHLVSRGRIPYRKLGRRAIFVREELEEFMNTLPGMRPADV